MGDIEGTSGTFGGHSDVPRGHPYSSMQKRNAPLCCKWLPGLADPCRGIGQVSVVASFGLSLFQMALLGNRCQSDKRINIIILSEIREIQL